MKIRITAPHSIQMASTCCVADLTAEAALATVAPVCVMRARCCNVPSSASAHAQLHYEAEACPNIRTQFQQSLSSLASELPLNSKHAAMVAAYGRTSHSRGAAARRRKQVRGDGAARRRGAVPHRCLRRHDAGRRRPHAARQVRPASKRLCDFQHKAWITVHCAHKCSGS